MGIPGLILLLAACAAPPHVRELPDGSREAGHGAQRPPVDVNIVSLQSDKLSVGQPIRIVNRWGNIEVRARPRTGSFDVTAAIQRNGEIPPPPPTLRQRVVDGTAEFRVDFPGARIEPARTGRVDLAVFVPPGHPLELEARDGLVKAGKTANPMRVRTDSGPIRIVNDGPIEVRSATGRIEVRPMYAQWGSLDARSESGAVIAYLPTHAPFELVVEGTEEIFSAYPLTPGAGRRTARHPGTVAATVNRVRLASASAIEVHEAHLADRRLEADAGPAE